MKKVNPTNDQITVLIADDEVRIRQMIKLYLLKENFQVLEAANGQEVLDIFHSQPVHLVILDLMMPEMDGLTACLRIRQESKVPIIMLTARGEETDRILGFELGADDYVVKPFSPKELLMRVKALLRRAHSTPESFVDQPSANVQKFGVLEIEPEAHRVKVKDLEITLTPLEFDLLIFLTSNPGRVFTREQLLEKVWGYDYFGEARTVDTHIKRLREKLSKGGTGAAEMVVTVWGVGYKFEVVK